MKTKIVRGAMLLLLSLIISRTSIGQTDNWEHRFLYFEDDSSLNPPQTTIVYKNGPLYTVRLEGDKILDFNVDGRQIPLDSLLRYRAVIEALKEDVRKARVQEKLDRVQAARDREQAMKDRAQAEKDREQAGRDREQADRDREQSVKDRAQAEKERDQALREQEQAMRDREQAEQDRQQSDRDRLQAEKDREQAVLDRKRAEEDRAILRSLIQDVVKDGLVPDADSVFSVKLNENEFILNGKMPSEAIQKKYIAKYAKSGSSISFNRGCCN